MESIGQLLQYCMQGLQYEFEVYGYSISMWQILIFDVVASIIVTIIGGVISNE